MRRKESICFIESVIVSVYRTSANRIIVAFPTDFLDVSSFTYACCFVIGPYRVTQKAPRLHICTRHSMMVRRNILCHTNTSFLSIQAYYTINHEGYKHSSSNLGGRIMKLSTEERTTLVRPVGSASSNGSEAVAWTGSNSSSATSAWVCWKPWERCSRRPNASGAWFTSTEMSFRLCPNPR